MEKIYNIIKLYFDNLKKQTFDKNNVVENIISVLDNKKNKKIPKPSIENAENDLVNENNILSSTKNWTEISNIFNMSNLSGDNCYEIFNKFDWNSFDEIKLKEILLNLKNILKLNKITDYEIKSFVKFLIKDLIQYRECSLERLEKENKNKELESKNKILRQKFLSELNNFETFLSWFNNYISTNIKINNFNSFEDLKYDNDSYAVFLELRKCFYSKYSENIAEKYRNVFENSNDLEFCYYAYILKEIFDLGELYNISKMSDEQFFLGLKRGFLLGDIYDFLNKKIKIFNGFENIIGVSLLREINKYDRK